MLRSLSVAAALCLALAAAAPARAVSIGLDQLVGGATLTSDDGRLSFSNFEVPFLLNLDTDLSQYTVTSLSDGFRITGPFDAPAGDPDGAQMTLSYDVTALSGTLDSIVLTHAADGAGLGTRSDVFEQVFLGTTQVGFLGDQLFFPNLPSTATSTQDLTALAATTLHIRKEIFVEAESEEGFGSVLYVDQRYPGEAVPEPGTIGLLGLGLGGLAVAGRRRR